MSDREESFGPIRRFWHRQIAWNIKPCGERDCTLKVCVAARHADDEWQRQDATRWCRHQPGWDENTMTFDGPDGRRRTSEQVYRERRVR